MKKSKLFYRVFIPLLFVEVVLVVAFFAYIYTSLYKSVSKNLEVERENYVVQVKNQFVQKMNNIEQAFSSYSSTETFKQDFNKELDFKDYLHIRSVSSELNYISLMGIENTEYSLINLKYKWKIKGNTINNMDTAEIKSVESLLAQEDNTIFFQQTSDGIKMVLELPVISKEKLAVGIAEIKPREMEKITNKAGNNQIAIMNKEGEIIYDSNVSLAKKELKLVQDSVKQSGNANYSFADKHTISKQSDDAQWTFVTVIQKAEVAKLISGTRNSLIIVMLLVLTLLVCVSYALTNFFLRPIKKIENHLNLETGQELSLDSIVHQIDKLKTDKKELAKSVSQNMIQLESLYVQDIFGKRLTASEIVEEFSGLRPQIKEQKFFVLACQINSASENLTSTLDGFAIRALTQEIFSDQNRLGPAVYAKNIQVAILFFSKDNKESNTVIIENCKKIVAYAQRLKVNVRFGISNCYEYLPKLSEGYQEARDALSHADGDKVISFYADYQEISELKKYPVEIENQLLETLREGDSLKCTECYDALFAEITGSNQSFLNIKLNISTLVNRLVEFNQLYFTTRPINELMQNYDELIAVNNIVETKENIFKRLVQPILNYQTSADISQVAAKMKTIIHTQYDQDISLEMLGEKLNYNPVYLSNAYKKEFGINFYDYLQDYRIEIAKRMLWESASPIKEIAETLRYTNSQNFIRFFKRKTGITPGEYRKRFVKID